MYKKLPAGLFICPPCISLRTCHTLSFKPQSTVDFKRVKVLSLDITGTLLAHTDPIAKTYVAAARWAMLKDPPTEKEMRHSFKKAYKQTCESFPCFGASHSGERAWWLSLLRLALRDCGKSYSEEEVLRYFRRVYQHYGTPSAYEILSDAGMFCRYFRAN
jgi:hypothetical protein